jgi:DNA-binding NtrC family response regulator
VSRILVVDDEHSVRHVLSALLTRQGHEVHTADSAEAAIDLLSTIPVPDVALVDLVLPGKNGLQLAKSIHARDSETRIIVITSHASVETAIGAIRQGAHDYLQKPFKSLEHVVSVVEGAVAKRRQTRELHELVDRQKELAEELAGAAAELGDQRDPD